MAKLDLKAATEIGRKIDLGDGKTFTVLYMSVNLNTNLSKQFKNVLPRNYHKLSAHERSPYLNLIYARSIIIDWENITRNDIYDDGSDEIVPFSVQACLDWLNNKSNEADRNTVISAAEDETLFELRKTEELIKKLHSTSTELNSDQVMKQQE